MKTNYIFKTIRIGLAVFALALGSSLASAQVATVYTYNLRSLANTVYAAGAITLVSDELTVEGATFKVQATVTPGGDATFVGSNGFSRWGVGSSVVANESTTFDGNHNESASISSISIVDFNANGTGYTVAAISDLHFDAITVRFASGSNDSPSITVDGATNSGTFMIGQLSNSTETIEFGVEFTNAASAPFTIGGTESVTNITIANATTHFQNSYQIIGTNVSYTFTTSEVLSVDQVTENDELVIYPNPVNDEVRLNIEIQSAKVIDVRGKVVKSFGNESDRLDITNLESGIYILKVVDVEGLTLVKKFIK